MSQKSTPFGVPNMNRLLVPPQRDSGPSGDAPTNSDEEKSPKMMTFCKTLSVCFYKTISIGDLMVLMGHLLTEIPVKAHKMTRLTFRAKRRR